MGSSSCWVIAGILSPLQDDEVEAVEACQHPLVVQARRHGIGTFLFADPEGASPTRLVIGTRIAVLGPENNASFTIATTSLDAVISTARERLRQAGFTEDVQVHMIWDQDR